MCTCCLAKYPFQKRWERACNPVMCVYRLWYTHTSSRDREEMQDLVFHRHWKNLGCLAWSGRLGILYSSAEYRSKLFLVLLDELIHSFWGGEVQDLMGEFSSLCHVGRQIN